MSAKNEVVGVVDVRRSVPEQMKSRVSVCQIDFNSSQCLSQLCFVNDDRDYRALNKHLELSPVEILVVDSEWSYIP